ncbi:MAG: DUF368 domain-containing protein [Clostridiales bacterium]|nr:DUF368 domain-containing protein [Clostridiales bacterium]
MKILFLILKGIAVGGANVMPGVSGATIAVIFRIYDDFINSINSLFKNTKESLKFLIPVGIGIVIGILAVGGVIDILLERFSMQAGGFIAGLMAGSLPFIYSQAVLKTEKKDSLVKYFIIAVISVAAIILLTLFAPTSSSGETEIALSVGLIAHLFIGGAIAGATMVIPGISGAMVLVLLGLYPIAIHTITQIREYLTSPMDFTLLGQICLIVIPLGIGIVAGALLGSKLIAILLEKFHSATYFAILGLVFGTIFVIFNNPDTYKSHETVTPILIIFTAITFIIGTLTSLRLGKQSE